MSCSREKRYQALSHFSILIVTESWVGPGNEAIYEGLHWMHISKLHAWICSSNNLYTYRKREGEWERKWTTMLLCHALPVAAGLGTVSATCWHRRQSPGCAGRRGCSPAPEWLAPPSHECFQAQLQNEAAKQTTSYLSRTEAQVHLFATTITVA